MPLTKKQELEAYNAAVRANCFNIVGSAIWTTAVSIVVIVAIITTLWLCFSNAPVARNDIQTVAGLWFFGITGLAASLCFLIAACMVRQQLLKQE